MTTTLPSLPDYARAQDYLFSLKASGVRYGIDRMQALVEVMDHPEHRVPVIHLAGTNGKGSTGAMLEAILRTAGWRTGMYTSPHLVKLGERVQVDREILSEEEILAYTNELRPLAAQIAVADAELHPSFFEFMTAMAFHQFARKSCDVAIIEVGLGGRLDATNVVQPEVAVITSIGLDHCQLLGDTEEAIAAEKAGIIKPGCRVVMGRLNPGAEAVVREIAARQGCPLLSVREEFGDDTANYPEPGLAGDYQRWNAATATLVARSLGPQWRLSPELITAGLRTARWPGRWEEITVGDRQVILDASHNPEGAQVLARNLSHLVRQTGEKPAVIVGVLGTVRAEPLLATIAEHASAIHLVRPDQSRACSPDELRALIPASFDGPVINDTVARLFPAGETCVAGRPGGTVVVTGSIYLLGEILVRLTPARMPNESRLQDF